MRRITSFLGLAMAAGMALSHPAEADPIMDPAMNESGIGSCPGLPTGWCASVNTQGQDPFNGNAKTLEYVFDSKVPVVLAGDVLITNGVGGSTSDLIRFENIGGVGAVAFVYSADIAGGLAADVGIPSVLQTLTMSVVENTDPAAYTLFTPTSVQPGYCTGADSCASFRTYGLLSADVPEPSGLWVIGSALLALGLSFAWRRKTSARG